MKETVAVPLLCDATFFSLFFLTNPRWLGRKTRHSLTLSADHAVAFVLRCHGDAAGHGRVPDQAYPVPQQALHLLGLELLDVLLLGVLLLDVLLLDVLLLDVLLLDILLLLLLLLLQCPLLKYLLLLLKRHSLLRIPWLRLL